MRRFCNYFVNLYNQTILSPFTKIVDENELELIKSKVKTVDSNSVSLEENEEIKSQVNINTTVPTLLPSFIIKEDVEDLLSNNVKEEKEISIIKTARSQTTRYFQDGNSNVNFAPVITNS